MTTRVSLIANNAVNSNTINNSTITAEDIENNAVTSDKLQSGGNDNVRAVGTNHIKDKAVSSDKLADDVSAYLSFPIGGIVMWSGTIAQIPGGWYLCDGGSYGGIKTPDLRNRFIVGAGSGYTPGNTGGADSVTLTVDQIPSHNHQQRNRAERRWGGSSGDASPNSRGTPDADPNNANEYRTFSTGGGQAHENRPPYYALAFIMKCEFRAGSTQTITTTVPTLQELRLNGPLYDQEMDGGAQKGNAGDTLISLGDGNGVKWSRVELNRLTANPGSTVPFPSANGPTSVNFSIPSWAKKITVMFSELSINSPTGVAYPNILVQLGSVSSVITSGYSATTMWVPLYPQSNNNGQMTGGTSTFGIKSNTGFSINYSNEYDIVKYTGSLTLANINQNTWVGTGLIEADFGTLGSRNYYIAGRVTLNDSISQVVVKTSNNVNAFDDGIVNVIYE